MSGWGEPFVDGDPVTVVGEGLGQGVVVWAKEAPRGGYQWVGVSIDGRQYGGVHVDRDGRDNKGRPVLIRTEEKHVIHHEYEPGETTHPMHTDPLCTHCGGPKGAPVHG